VTAGDWVERASDVRRELPKPLYDVVARLMGDGWRLRRQGHKFRLHCPCGDRRGWIRVDGTPRNADWRAREVDRASRHCPDGHDRDGH